MAGPKLQLLLETTRRLIRRQATANLKRIIDKTHPADIAHLFKYLTERDQRVIFDLIDDSEKAAEVLSEIDKASSTQLLEGMDRSRITDILQVKKARKMGLDIIITDHHSPLPETPDAVAVVNPKLTASAYPFSQLSGVGVAFKLLQALLQSIGKEEQLDMVMDMVAIGTIADLSPLVGMENLKTLRLDETPVSDLTPLAELTSLEDLNLASTPVSNLAPLAKLEHLKRLDLRTRG